MKFWPNPWQYCMVKKPKLNTLKNDWMPLNFKLSPKKKGSKKDYHLLTKTATHLSARRKLIYNLILINTYLAKVHKNVEMKPLQCLIFNTIGHLTFHCQGFLLCTLTGLVPRRRLWFLFVMVCVCIIFYRRRLIFLFLCIWQFTEPAKIWKRKTRSSNTIYCKQHLAYYYVL